MILIFLEDEESSTFLLNPITRQQVQIPELTLPDSISPNWIWVYGFGYDSSTDDFKVVMMSYTANENEDNNEHNGVVTLVDVYSVKRGSWYRVNDIYPYGQLVPSISSAAQGAFVNGAVHWFISERSRQNSGLRCHIAAFDLANEVFHEIPMPVLFDRNHRARGEHRVTRPSDYNGLTVIGGCLWIIDNLSNGTTDVWVMKEYGVVESWLKFHISHHNYGEILVPLSFIGDEQLICYTDRDALVACDLKDGTTKKVIVGGVDTWYWGGRAFVDTLMSPGKCEM